MVQLRLHNVHEILSRGLSELILGPSTRDIKSVTVQESV